MDVDVARWVLEFLLLQNVGDQVLNSILRVIPVPHDDSKLSKRILLRRIESEIATGVSEKILELLEQIEELDQREGVSASEAIKAAYCAVAVHCSVRFLNENDDSGWMYFDAVKRIWRGRVAKMEKVERRVGLVSDELKGWKDDIEAALWDTSVCKNVQVRSRENDALGAVKAYVAEAKERMGPSFLEFVAGIVSHDKMKELLGWGNLRDCDQAGKEVAGLPDSCHGLAVNRDKRGAVSGDSMEELLGSGSDLNYNQVGKESAIVPDSCHDFAVNEDDRGMLKSAAKRRHKHVASKHTRGVISGSSRGVKISDTEEMDVRTLANNHDGLPIPEIDKVQEALRTSSLELQAVVKDPLPEALQFAEKVISGMSRENMNKDAALGGHSGVDVDATNPSIDKCAEAAQGNGANLDNHSYRHLNDLSKPSLMVWNSTACTYEWDDSIDALSEGSPDHRSRPNLPTPRRVHISPLKKYEIKNITKRRKPKKWSLVEEDTLRAAVLKYGQGNWKFILNQHHDVFEERTDVDLKDKWRNMTRR
ncbi:hypothetical protein NMG60_11029660 [Bertholletia excelsa]